jgi:hypothetical protein
MSETPCRRCSDCEGMSHHWMDNPDFGSEGQDAEHPEATHICKHCEVVGVECEWCDGEGCYLCDDEGVCQAAAENHKP